MTNDYAKYTASARDYAQNGGQDYGIPTIFFSFFFKTHDYASDGSPDQAGNFPTKQCSCYGTINSRQDRALHLHMHDKQCIISVRGRPVNSTPKVEYY